MKVRELIEILKGMDQEADVYVAGGYTEYATTNISVYKSGDDVNIREE